MSLDSKSKRGSVMLLTLPYRPWLTEPTGTLSALPRLPLLKLCSSIDPTFVGNYGGRLNYRAADTRPHYRAADTRLHYRDKDMDG